MNSGPTLSSGSTGPDVRRLQRLLVELKILSFDQIDGNFGPRTEAAVKDFQVDGIVGDRTWWVPAGAAGATLAPLSGVTTA
jgi:peptidoglycan hydrolase-like protein with peptidoglycan-binding domain